MVSLKVIGYTNPRGALEDIQAGNKELRGCEINGQSNHDLTHGIGPATDPGRNMPTPDWR